MVTDAGSFEIRLFSGGDNIAFMFEEDTPVTLDLAKLRAATPRILERYRVPADRYLK